MLKYIVTNVATGDVRIFSTVTEVKDALSFGDDDVSPELIDALDENGTTYVDDETGVRYKIELKQDPSPPGGEGGRRKSSRKKQMPRTRKHGGRRPHKTVKRSGAKYMEVPRSRSVFQMEGARRKSHRRLKMS